VNARGTLPGHWIDGAWTGGRADEVSTNPSRPHEEIARFCVGTADEVDAAVAAARRASRPWSAAGGVARGRVLRRAAQVLEGRADELVALFVAEEGKTALEARGEVARAVETLHYNAARALASVGATFDAATDGVVAHVRRVPVGVVAAITPWNFPVAIPVWKLAPALAHGNTVVWKPSELVPATSTLLLQILAEAGLPDGALAMVLGDGTTGGHLIGHEGIDAASFTGSAATGQRILDIAGPRGIRLQLELGGHNPAIVFADADLAAAAEHVVAGAMLSTGQKCTATRRVLVAEKVHDELLDRIVDRAAALRVGDAAAATTDVGPLVSADALTRVRGAVARAEAQGATVCTGDAIPDGPGHLVAPTVLSVPSHDLDVCHEEVFGPVTAVLPVADDDAAFRLANDTTYGLSAAVHTRDPARIRRALDELEVGMLTVNGPTTGAEPHVPFGGVKGSSGPAGREMGEAARDFYTDTRTAYLDHRFGP